MKAILLALPVGFGRVGCAADGKLPADVLRFMDRMDLCDHLRGEFSGHPESDSDRIDLINNACTGIDRELAAPIVRYRHHQRVLETLSKYERSIESNRRPTMNKATLQLARKRERRVTGSRSLELRSDTAARTLSGVDLRRTEC